MFYEKLILIFDLFPGSPIFTRAHTCADVPRNRVTEKKLLIVWRPSLVHFVFEGFNKSEKERHRHSEKYRETEGCHLDEDGLPFMSGFPQDSFLMLFQGVFPCRGHLWLALVSHTFPFIFHFGILEMSEIVRIFAVSDMTWLCDKSK